MQSLPNPLNIVLVLEPDAERKQRVLEIAPGRLKVDEIPPSAIRADDADLTSSSPPAVGQQARDRLLREAHVMVIGFPVLPHLYARTSRLLWAHHPTAGASNLLGTDIWDSSVPLTTSRGSNAALPIAEMTFAGGLILAKGLHAASRGSTDRRDYHSNLTIAGKTMGVLGLGGIGGHVARIARGAGMRVVATRRSCTQRQHYVQGVDVLFPPGDLYAMLAECDFLAVCANLTQDTRGVLDGKAFQALKSGAILMNVSRGDIIDEDAMISSIKSGRLRGAYLDVYVGDPAPPRADLAALPNVVITPHISGFVDQPGPLGFDIFIENLKLFLRGEALHNVVDRARGY